MHRLLTLPRSVSTFALVAALFAATLPGPDSRAAAGYPLSLFSTECPDPLALDGTPITEEICETTDDRTFELAGPDGQQVELVTELQYGDDGPQERAARWSADAADDREDSGTYTLTEPAEDPDNPTFYQCLLSTDGGLVPADLTYVEGGVEFPWTPAVYSTNGMEGEGLACNVFSRPVDPDLPTAGILRVTAAYGLPDEASDEASELVVVAPGDDPYVLTAEPTDGVAEPTYTLSSEDGGDITLAIPETERGLATASFPLPPGDYTLTADETGTTAPVSIESGQTVLAFNEVQTPGAGRDEGTPGNSDEYAPTPAPDSEPQIEAVDTFAFTADDWVGAYEDVDTDVYRRDCVAVYGVDSINPSGVFTFDLDAVTIGNSELVLTGLDDEMAGGNPIVVTVNGKVIFDDESSFYDWDPNDPEVHWNRLVIPFANGVLVEGENEIVVTNTSDGTEVGVPPYLLLSEAWVFVGLTGGIG